MYYLLKPPYTDFTISTQYANILSNYILTNYPKHFVKNELEESEQKETEIKVYTPIDKQANFKGGK